MLSHPRKLKLTGKDLIFNDLNLSFEVIFMKKIMCERKC